MMCVRICDAHSLLDMTISKILKRKTIDVESDVFHVIQFDSKYYIFVCSPNWQRRSNHKTFFHPWNVWQIILKRTLSFGYIAYNSQMFCIIVKTHLTKCISLIVKLSMLSSWYCSMLIHFWISHVCKWIYDVIESTEWNRILFIDRKLSSRNRYFFIAFMIRIFGPIIIVLGMFKEQ